LAVLHPPAYCFVIVTRQPLAWAALVGVLRIGGGLLAVTFCLEVSRGFVSPWGLASKPCLVREAGVLL
jgi:hypothetical protein